VDNNAEVDRIDEMMTDFSETYHAMEEESEPMAQAFYLMLSASDEPLHEKTRVTQLNADIMQWKKSRNQWHKLSI
jgi:hypothetical protein